MQIRDTFFHNANSAFRKELWKKFPFDEQVTNIEDRVWGQKVIENGFKIIYQPKASVYHYHGIHHNQNPERAKNVVRILDGLKSTSTKKNLKFKKSSNSVEKVNSILFEKRENVLKKSKSKNFDRTLKYDKKNIVSSTNPTNIFQDLNTRRQEKIQYFQDLTRKATSGALESSTRDIFTLVTIAQIGPKFYGITEIGASWEEAHSQLDTLRALYEDFELDADVHLLTINTQEEQSLIYQGIMDSTRLNRGLIGLTDEVVEGDWQWVTGEEVNYTNWNNGEPNNAGNVEDHVVMNMDAGGAWDDANGLNSWNYIVEITLNMPSEPDLVFLGEYNGSEYAASYEPLSYHDLPGLVDTMNMQEPDLHINIVTITSPEENLFLSSEITNNDTLPSDARYWSGLTDHEVEGDWKCK